MSDTRHGVPLLRRIVAEHRRLIYPLAIALVVNIVVYAAFVFPLARRVANVEQRDRAAELEMAAATRELTRARGILTGKDRAAKELETFYTEVLPRDLQGARRLTSLRLQQLAREAGLRAESTGISEARAGRGETLQGLEIDMLLTGTYPALRAFIYQLETAPEFVVIDTVQLSEGADGGELRITMTLSTYYRSEAS